jgi:flagellar basal body P-ring protein FlgI
MIKDKKSDLSHLRIIESATWVHILKKKIKKLDDRFWESILVSYESENQYRIYDSRTDKVHIVRDVEIDKMTHLRAQFDESSDSNDDDFWTHEDDKLLNSNFEIENSSSISSRSRSKSKTTDNKVELSDLSENLDSVRASTNDLINVLDQVMKNLNLDTENHFETFSESFSAN